MKGFVKTLEASIGTLVVLGMLLAFASTDFGGTGDPGDVEDVEQQLNAQNDLLREALDSQDASMVEEEVLETSVLNKNVALHLENNTYRSSTDSSLEQSFVFDDDSYQASVFLWGSGEPVSMDLNGESVYSGEPVFESVHLPVSEGDNVLEFSNPSGERFSYLLVVEKRFGDPVPDSGEVYVVTEGVRIDPGLDGEVNVYLWR